MHRGELYRADNESTNLTFIVEIKSSLHLNAIFLPAHCPAEIAPSFQNRKRIILFLLNPSFIIIYTTIVLVLMRGPTALLEGWKTLNLFTLGKGVSPGWVSLL